jgi:hypothetical protein
MQFVDGADFQERSKKPGPTFADDGSHLVLMAEDLERGGELDVRGAENPKIGVPDDGSAHALGHSLGGKDDDRRAGCPKNLPGEVDHTPIGDDDSQRLGREAS